MLYYSQYILPHATKKFYVSVKISYKEYNSKKKKKTNLLDKNASEP